MNLVCHSYEACTCRSLGQSVRCLTTVKMAGLLPLKVKAAVLVVVIEGDSINDPTCQLPYFFYSKIGFFSAKTISKL